VKNTVSFFWLSASVLFAPGALAGTPALPTAPAGGMYAANIFVTQTTGSGCLDGAGSQVAGIVNYAGISSAALTLRVPLVQQGAAVVSTQRLTIKSGAGSTHPSGSFTWQGRGVGRSWDKSGTFSATLTEIDGYSFVAQIEETYGTYGACTEQQLISLARIGARS
jgi:hypothetical protein